MARLRPLAAKAKKAPKVPAIAGPKIVDPKPTKKVRPPKPTDTGGRKVPKKKRPTPKVSDTGTGLRRPRIARTAAGASRQRTNSARARMGNRSRRGLRR